MIKHIKIGNFENEILNSIKPILAIFLGQHHDQKSQLKILHNIAQKIPEYFLKFYLLEEESTSEQTVLNIVGAPTYILVDKQQVIDKLLGQADEKNLLDFIIKGIPDLLFLADTAKEER